MAYILTGHKTLFFDDIELPIGAIYEKTVYAILQIKIHN